MSRDKNMTILKPVVFLVYRSDDNEESLRKRFVTYEEATMPIIR
jgi:adenylate kinase family enzyme